MPNNFPIPGHESCSSLFEIKTDYKEVQRLLSKSCNKSNKQDSHTARGYVPVFKGHKLPTDGPIVSLNNLKDSLLPGEELYFPYLTDYALHAKKTKKAERRNLAQKNGKPTCQNMEKIIESVDDSEDDLLDWEKRQELLTRISMTLESDQFERKNERVGYPNSQKVFSPMLSKLGNQAIKRVPLGKNDEQNSLNILKNNSSKKKPTMLESTIVNAEQNKKKDKAGRFEYEQAKSKMLPIRNVRSSQRLLGKSNKTESGKYFESSNEENNNCDIKKNTTKGKSNSSKLTRKNDDAQKNKLAKQYKLMEEKISTVDHEDYLKLIPSDSESNMREEILEKKCKENNVFIKPKSCPKRSILKSNKKQNSTLSKFDFSTITFNCTVNNGSRRRTLYSPTQFENSEDAKKLFSSD